MDVEFEHGAHDPQTDVTGDDPIAIGKIALAHMKEFPDYYERLERMEREAERPQPDPDHPLAEEEREEKPPATGCDEWAHLDQELVGDDFGTGSRRRRAGLASRATVRTSSFAP
jgi:Protein of unknown function (DUF5661)